MSNEMTSHSNSLVLGTSPFNVTTAAAMIVAAAATETVPCDVVDTPALSPTREHQRSAPMSCRCLDTRAT